MLNPLCDLLHVTPLRRFFYLLADSFLSFSMVQIRAHVPWPIFFAWYFCLRCPWIHLQDTFGPRFLFPSKVTTQVRPHASAPHILYLCLGTPLKPKKLALECFDSTDTHLQFLLPLYVLFLDGECTSASLSFLFLQANLAFQREPLIWIATFQVSINQRNSLWNLSFQQTLICNLFCPSKFCSWT